MSVAHNISSSIPEAQNDNASREFFELIMSGQIADYSEEELAEAVGSRDSILDTLKYNFPARQEPKNIDRSASELLDMATWERTPLVEADVESAA